MNELCIKHKLHEDAKQCTVAKQCEEAKQRDASDECALEEASKLIQAADEALLTTATSSCNHDKRIIDQNVKVFVRLLSAT